MAEVIRLAREIAEKFFTATYGERGAPYLDPAGPYDDGTFVLSIECASNPIYAHLASDMATVVAAEPEALALVGRNDPDPWSDVRAEIDVAVAEGRLEEVRAEKLDAIDIAIATIDAPAEVKVR